MEEIRNVTYGLWGQELKEWQAIQRLVLAGFHDPRVLLDMFAIIEGESGSYTQAWHMNVARDADKNIVRDDEGRMRVKSIDLGFIQRNVILEPDPLLEMTEEAVKPFVDGMFLEYPHLARADLSAAEAFTLYAARGFSPWYAYKPDSPGYKLKKRRGAKAIGNYLLRTQVGKIDEDGELATTFPRLEFE